MTRPTAAAVKNYLVSSALELLAATVAVVGVAAFIFLLHLVTSPFV